MQHAISSYYARPRGAQTPTLTSKSRDNFVQLIRQVRPYLPHHVSKGAMNTFAVMASVTRISDWTTPGQEPCCYMAQTEVAKLADCSVSRVRAHEAELVVAGLIEKRTSGNGARSGWLERGIYFNPALAREQEFLGLAAQIEAERREAARLRGLRSTHRRHLNAAIDALAGYLPANDARLEAFRNALILWPSADKLHSMPLWELTEHESLADELCRGALDLLEKIEYSNTRPPENERSYIQNTTQTSDSESCNARVNKWPSGKPDELHSYQDAPHGASCIEKDDAAASGAIKSEFLDKLSPERLYGLSSPEMQMHLDARRYRSGSLVFHDFVVAAQNRLPELGVNHSAWTTAVQTMGEDTAMMCVLVLDASRDRPGLPVSNPGGYLRGMTRAAARGDLNIIGSLIGLSERKKNAVS